MNPVCMDHKRLTKVLIMVNFISENQEAEFFLFIADIRKKNLVNLNFA